MYFTSTILALLSASAVWAAPMDHRLEDIQCRCLSFATDARPSVCTYMGAHRLDWYTANTLASDYDLKINFASQSTITKVLSIRKPLPSSMLQSIEEGEVMAIDAKDLVQRENKIVCGFSEELRHLGESEGGLEQECHFVGWVVGIFMVLLALYVLAEYVWSRFFSQGSIKLDGDEKALMAEYEAEEEHEDSAAPADFS